MTTSSTSNYWWDAGTDAKLNLPGRNTPLNVPIADTFFSRTKGLRLKKDGAMLFELSEEDCRVVDSILMLKPVHLYFLDENYEVIETGVLEPWRTYTPEKQFKYLLESFQDLSLETGDSLTVMKLHRMRSLSI